MEYISRLLVVSLALWLLAACDNADNTDHYSGKELVDALVFSSEDHRAQHHCIIAKLRDQYEASTGATHVNLDDGDTELVVSWCDINDDPNRLCERGGGLPVSSTGDVGVAVYSFTPGSTGLVSDYRYSSELVENDPNGWRSGITMDWNTRKDHSVAAFQPGFSRLIDGQIRNLESPAIAISPDIEFVSSDIVGYYSTDHYTLNELLAAVSDSDDSLRTLLIRYFNAVENDLELQAINDPSIDEAMRDNYLNALHAEFDGRRANANAFAGRWRALLAEQLLVVEDCLHLAQ